MRISSTRLLPLSLILIAAAASVAAAQTYPGDLVAVARHGNSVTLRGSGSSVRVSFCAGDIARVDLLPRGSHAPDSSFAVIRRPDPALLLRLVESDSDVTIATRSLTVRCLRHPIRLSFIDSAGRAFLSETPGGGLGVAGEMRVASFSIGPHEHFYGTGERGDGLDRRGKKFDCWNTQVGGYVAPPATMNVGVPFIASSAGYGLFFDNTYRGTFDVGSSDPVVLSYTAAGGEMTYYVVAAGSLRGEVERYTWLTGRPVLPPRWAFGYIQSKNRYRNEEEARAVVRTMRAEHIPCDAIVLDLQWFRSMGDLSWDSTAWPDPGRMMSDFLRQGIKTILITEPYIVQPSHNYDEALRRGFVAGDSRGRPYALDGWWSCGGCTAALLDITSPAAASWWWDKYPLFMDTSVAGLWTDLGEPERHPADMVHYLGPAGRVHNIYDFLWAETIFEGMQRFRPGERVFNLTRSGWAGIQRFGVVTWSGDVSRTFEGLAAQIPIVLNMGISGLVYQNSDIGGYARNPTTAELYTRWMEFGVFTPIARAHGAGEMTHGSPTEPWMFGPETETICREMIRLRYRLLPYIYSTAHEACVSGLPLARPLVMAYPGDARFADESSSYLWGDALMVTPVLRAGASSRKVEFPAGEWVDFWTDEVIPGGTSRDVPAPLETIPLFVRRGSIIAMAQEMAFTDERPADTLTLHVYPSLHDPASATLYEDDGKTTAYLSGRYALTRFGAQVRQSGGDARLVIRLGAAEGSFPGRLARRTCIVEVHTVAAPPSGVTVDASHLERAARSDPGQIVRGAYAYDPRLSVLTFAVTGPTDRTTTVVVSGIRLR